jgi:hypothetical protein
MADAVVAQLAAYRAAKLDQNGQSHEKCEIVRDLEDHLGQPKVLAFYLDLIADPDEYDMARLEALKILQLWDPPNDRVCTRVGRRLAGVLLAEPDVLIQQWMAIAAENFVIVAEVFSAASLLLADREADLDVRHNCLTAVQRLGPSDEVRNLLESLAPDPQLGVHVRRILKEWGRRAEPGAAADDGA